MIPEGFKLCNCKVWLISAEQYKGNNVFVTKNPPDKSNAQTLHVNLSSQMLLHVLISLLGKSSIVFLYSLNGYLMFYVTLVSLFLTQPISACTLDTLFLENHSQSSAAHLV